jgi:hypothetical protein
VVLGRAGRCCRLHGGAMAVGNRDGADGPGDDVGAGWAVCGLWRAAGDGVVGEGEDRRRDHLARGARRLGQCHGLRGSSNRRVHLGGVRHRMGS